MTMGTMQVDAMVGPLIGMLREAAARRPRGGLTEDDALAVLDGLDASTMAAVLGHATAWGSLLRVSRVEIDDEGRERQGWRYFATARPERCHEESQR